MIQSNHVMSTDAEPHQKRVEELVKHFRDQLVPLTSKFSYFSTTPMAEDDLRQYLNDPSPPSPRPVARSCPK